jgi:hypothetical protein
MDKRVGTMQEGNALQGRGALQSDEEWEARNHHLADSLSTHQRACPLAHRQGARHRVPERGTNRPLRRRDRAELAGRRTGTRPARRGPKPVWRCSRVSPTSCPSAIRASTASPWRTCSSTLSRPCTTRAWRRSTGCWLRAGFWSGRFRTRISRLNPTAAPAAISPLALEAVRRIDALFEIERSING